MNQIAQCFDLEEIDNLPEPKVMVIKLKNPRWGGWAVYRSWEAVHEVVGDLLEETWDEQERYAVEGDENDIAHRCPLFDEYQIEMGYMTEREIEKLMPLDY